MTIKEFRVNIRQRIENCRNTDNNLIFIKTMANISCACASDSKSYVAHRINDIANRNLQNYLQGYYDIEELFEILNAINSARILLECVQE